MISVAKIPAPDAVLVQGAPEISGKLVVGRLAQIDAVSVDIEIGGEAQIVQGVRHVFESVRGQGHGVTRLATDKIDQLGQMGCKTYPFFV